MSLIRKKLIYSIQYGYINMKNVIFEKKNLRIIKKKNVNRLY